MNISINKDIETEYRDEAVKGFSLKELGCVALTAAAVLGTAAVAYFGFGLPLKYGCYIGIPLAFPVIFLGFRKFQGLSALDYAKEILYEKRTRRLLYDTGEMKEPCRAFSLKKKKGTRRAGGNGL